MFELFQSQTAMTSCSTHWISLPCGRRWVCFRRLKAVKLSFNTLIIIIDTAIVLQAVDLASV